MNIPVNQRLIVAADFKRSEYNGLSGVRREILGLAKDLAGSGVIIKVNFVLRALGYQLIDDLHSLGVGVFADLKLNDIGHTLEGDAEFLNLYKPEMLTVMAGAGEKAIQAMIAIIEEEIEVLGVTLLTSIGGDDCQEMYDKPPVDMVVKFAQIAVKGCVDGLILSPNELSVVKAMKGLPDLTFNTPGIRPTWSLVEGDDQARVMTPKAAVMAGADRIVVGRPIIKAKNRLEAVHRTLEEIEMALAS